MSRFGPTTLSSSKASCGDHNAFVKACIAGTLPRDTPQVLQCNLMLLRKLVQVAARRRNGRRTGSQLRIQAARDKSRQGDPEDSPMAREAAEQETLVRLDHTDPTAE